MKLNYGVKRALISVSDTTKLADFAQNLCDLGIDIIATGGTSRFLHAAGIPNQDVSEVTQFPEIMGGRVKTLHPKIHGAILGRRNQDAIAARQYNIEWIDLVVVNLYPFADVISKPNSSFDEAIENIDIGGPAMIRSAAKNMDWVTVVVDPNDYEKVMIELRNPQGINAITRKNLAAKAFQLTCRYDAMIHQFLSGRKDAPVDGLPPELDLAYQKKEDLRYGENPQQRAAAYFNGQTETGVLSAKQNQGKPLSFNNIVDADAAMACVREFDKPAAVIVKHANPCGVALGDTIETAFARAVAADKDSSFGGIIALNTICNEETAKKIATAFFEVVIAPEYAPMAYEIFVTKANLRVLELPKKGNESPYEYKFIEGGVLMQDKDLDKMDLEDLKIVLTKTKPSKKDLEELLFAWRVVKHIKSNAIVIAKDNQTIGLGIGQVSRVDAVDNAIRKAGDKISGAVLASDAFFPFRDSIDRIANSGIRAIIQPGGSMRDEEVIAACDEHGIAMVFTGKRCFKH